MKFDTFAGHGEKSLTLESSDDNSGVVYLWARAGDKGILLTLTPDEKAELAQLLFEPGKVEREVTRY